MSVAVATPTSVENNWPVIQYDSTAPGHPYREFVVHFRADNVTSFDILVDFARAKIVEIQPDEHAVVSQLSDATPVVDR